MKIKSNLSDLKVNHGVNLNESTNPPTITLIGDNPMSLEVGMSTYTEPGAVATDYYGQDVPVSISGSVDTSKIGVYTVVYTAIDSLGNKAEATRIVNVIDTTPPSLTLLGNNPMTLEVGLSTYIEPGATFSDNSGEPTTIIISGTVNTNKIGQYLIRYIASDSSNNKSEATRVVNVIDTTPPVITIVGDNPTILEVGLSNYNEQGATVSDNSKESVIITISGQVNTAQIGEYSIIYSATDSSNNKSQSVRVIKVIDTTCPEIILNGNNPLTLEVGLSDYNEAGAIVIDNSSEKIKPIIYENVNTKVIGQYEVKYTATDSSNNTNEAIRIVNVIDTIKPNITLNGDNPSYVELGLERYVEKGATVTDNSGEVIEARISGFVDDTKLGQYKIDYFAVDSSGNEAVVSRIVNVVDTTPPTITLNGYNPMNLEVGLSTYIEPGAIVDDNSGEFIQLYITGTVNTNKIGQYIITYLATDSSNNSYVTTREVNVTDTTCPSITLIGDNTITMEVGISEYSEPGVIITDNSGENIEAVITGTLNTKKIGQYTLLYTATDSSNNSSNITRLINVIDTTPPVINLIGSNPMTIEVYDQYQEPGADIIDNSGENIVPLLHGYVDYNKIGVYKVTYNATDSSGNKAKEVIRTVNVVAADYVRCSQIVAYNNRGVITKWGIYTMDDKLIYQTGNYLQWQQWIFNMDTLNVPPNTLCYIKAIVEGNDEIANMNIKYIPNSNTAYFQLTVSNDEFFVAGLYYNGVVNSNGTPPVLLCNKISCKHNASVTGYLEVLTLEGKLLFVSPLLQENDTVNVSLSTLGIDAGTTVKFYADVLLGSDSSPYLHFLYIPTQNVTAKLSFQGVAFRTIIEYEGKK